MCREHFDRRGNSCSRKEMKVSYLEVGSIVITVAYACHSYAHVQVFKKRSNWVSWDLCFRISMKIFSNIASIWWTKIDDAYTNSVSQFPKVISNLHMLKRVATLIIYANSYKKSQTVERVYQRDKKPCPSFIFICEREWKVAHYWNQTDIMLLLSQPMWCF